jgi:hypothetical protein
MFGNMSNNKNSEKGKVSVHYLGNILRCMKSILSVIEQLLGKEQSCKINFLPDITYYATCWIF